MLDVNEENTKSPANKYEISEYDRKYLERDSDEESKRSLDDEEEQDPCEVIERED